MSRKEDIAELTRKLLCIHIDCNKLAIEERDILKRLAVLNGSRQLKNIKSETTNIHERKGERKLSAGKD